MASRNRADFRNLMDVYLDAVFHPRAVEEEGWWVLRQEGWRYDVVGGEDGEGRDLAGNPERADFEYKGVVFSEMKGAYSDPEDKLERITQSLLFPDNPYHFDSGGDPTIIPTLTRDEFVGFYKKVRVCALLCMHSLCVESNDHGIFLIIPKSITIPQMHGCLLQETKVMYTMPCRKQIIT